MYADWVAEGSPPRFERMGTFGGRRYVVLNYSTSTPTFLVHVADGPTEFDTDDPEDDGAIKKLGYVATVNEDAERFRVDGRGKVAIRRPSTRVEKD